MHAPTALTPKKRAALLDCARAGLVRCHGGFRAVDGTDVHTKRVVNQLANEGLVSVSFFERDVAITETGRALAADNGLQVSAA